MDACQLIACYGIAQLERRFDDLRVQAMMACETARVVYN